VNARQVPAEDRRDKFLHIRGYPEDITRVTTAAAAAGIAPTRWAGDALAGALEDATGWRDEARRPAPRRPNRQDRQGRWQGTRLNIKVSGEEHERIGQLAKDKGVTVTEWAWAVLGEALEKEGQQ